MIMFVRRFIVLMGFIFSAISASAYATVPIASFEKLIADIGNSDTMVGFAVAVVRDGEVDFIQTYGTREAGGVDMITPQTTFRVASLSKAFAATVAVQLDLEGKLSLDDLIVSSNPAFRLKSQAEADSATLSHALSHRLSLPPYAYDNLLESGVSPNKIISEMKRVDPICKVGSCYAYQNVGFNMIAPAIEVADKQAYSDSVRKRLFEPLQMSGASFTKSSLTSSGNWARSYRRRPGKSWKLVTVKQPYYDVPAAGGINANIGDMAKWLAAQMGSAPQVVSDNVLARLHSPDTKTRSELRRIKHMGRVTQAHYGLGWRIYQYAGHKVVNHSGSVEGYAAQIAFLPAKNVGLVMLTNSKTKKFWRILPRFLDQELGLSPPK